MCTWAHFANEFFLYWDALKRSPQLKHKTNKQRNRIVFWPHCNMSDALTLTITIWGGENDIPQGGRARLRVIIEACCSPPPLHCWGVWSVMIWWGFSCPVSFQGGNPLGYQTVALCVSSAQLASNIRELGSKIPRSTSAWNTICCCLKYHLNRWWICEQFLCLKCCCSHWDWTVKILELNERSNKCFYSRGSSLVVLHVSSFPVWGINLLPLPNKTSHTQPWA